MKPDLPLEWPELEKRLRAVEPGVWLMPPKLLRRVIKKDRHWHWFTFRIPHQQSHLIGKERLVEALQSLDAALPPGEWPDEIILLAATAPQAPEELTGPARMEFHLAHFWRQLFHAKLHRSVHAHAEAQGRQRWEAISENTRSEIRLALQQERLLVDPATDAALYEELLVFYWELQFFAPQLLPLALPSMDAADKEIVREQEGIATQVLGQTRPSGIESPLTWRKDLQRAASRAVAAAQEQQNILDAQAVAKLVERADQALASGNTVLAARLRRSAMRAADAGRSAAAAQALDSDLQLLTERLLKALELPMDERTAWQAALQPLVRPSEEGYRLETRALYELQKICLDAERGLYTVDLVEWVRSFGAQRLQRPLPWAEALSRLRRLRQVERFMRQARLTTEQLTALDALLDAALHHQEILQRERLRPVLHEALDAVGLVPQNAAERVAQRKVVEELIDHLLARGHLSLGPLRDALSRNQLKMPDLAGPLEFWRGDQLLQLDKRLARGLDGVYRRGEFYLRWFQRFSSLFFATAPGRFLSRFLLLPLVGAFVVLEGLQHIVGPLLKPVLHEEPHLVSALSVCMTGYVLLGLLYVDRFRKETWRGLKWVGRGLRSLFVEMPARLATSPAVRTVWQAPPVRIFRHHLLLPLLLALLAWGIGFYLGASPQTQWIAALVSFGLAVLFFSTRWGRLVREMLLEAMSRSWHVLGVDFFVMLLRFIWDAFRWLIALMDQALYYVDEHLRFRSGENAFTLAMKAAFGVVWFFLAYVARFGINLLLEPQINPIKHFPVVTVSHKLILPLAAPGGALSRLFQAGFGLSATAADATAITVVSGIPGIFGFLAWELKENWKLYRANRSATLQPVIVGSHGETVLRLLKPGFHSGTLPKLYGKLRRAAALDEHSPKALKLHHELEHVMEEVRRLVQRSLLNTLQGSAVWQGQLLTVGAMMPAPKSIRFVLHSPLWPEHPLTLSLRERHGWLLAQVVDPGWAGLLTPEQTEALVAALAGFYKLAGVDLVVEQLSRLWPPPARFHAVEPGVEVQPSPADKSAVFPWTDEDAVTPEPPINGLSTVPTPWLYFSRLPIAWQHWGVAWEREQEGKRADLPLHDVQLLPGVSEEQTSFRREKESSV